MEPAAAYQFMSCAVNERKSSSLKSSITSANKILWEEEAFAEDAAGPFGAFVWPPRCYFCSFCGREFRSAQALGGHMNVHRRQRARLNHHQQQRHRDQTADPGAKFDTSDETPVNLTPPVCSLISKDNSYKHEIIPESLAWCSNIARKRRRTDGLPLMMTSLFPCRSSSIDCNNLQFEQGESGVIGFSTIATNNADEDLDLELRLGIRPPTVRFPS